MSVRAHLLGLYTVLIASACTAALDATCSAPIPPYPPSANDVEDFVGTPFDVLIIGGGTAGLALASRLAVNSSIVVGVIEAGRLHLNDPIIDAPRLAGTGGASSDYDWNFTSIAQVNAADRNIRITRGKLLGGSSGVNGLAWGRASSPEYDAWVPFADESWSFDRLLPYFKRSENLSNIPNPYPGVSDPSEGPPSQSSGSGGPVQAGHYSWYPPIVFPIAQAVNNMGVATNPFPDDGNATGLTDSYQSVDVSTGMRSYSANAYYCNQPSKSNLKVLAGAQVSRVLFAGAANTSLFATGVEFIVGSQAFNISASKEVVLSAGTIQTPQILELSGIGSSSILSSAGIPVLQDLPSVGANLQDHVYSLVQYQLVPGQETFDILRNNATFAEEQMALYNATGTGLYANSDSSLVFLPFQALVDGARRGELLAILDEEIANATSSPVVHAQLLQQRDYFVEGNVAAAELIQWSRGIVNPEANESYVDILGGLMHMTSRGSVHIASSDPLAPPVIDPNFLGSKFDQELLMDIVKYIFQLGKTTPFSNYIAALSSPSSIPADDATLLTFLQNSCSDGGHLVGTAVMAPASMGGVVDANFKVYGTQNLRVVDASIFSVNIAAHTQATVYAIAEKAADVMAGAL